MSWSFARSEEIDFEDIPGYLSEAKTDQDELLLILRKGEIFGGATFRKKDEFNQLGYIEIQEKHRGTSLNGDSAAEALVKQVEEEVSGKPLKSEAVAMHGKIQHLRQENGFETSGFYLNNFTPELDEAQNIEETAFGGFDAELWKEVDETVEMYLPEEIRDFAEKSLENQRDIIFREPRDKRGYSLEIQPSRGGMNKNQVLRAEIGKGDTEIREILMELEAVEDDSLYWAQQVDINPESPEAFSAARHLYGQGYRPTNLKPGIDGGQLSMSEIKMPVGYYGLTPETLELVEKSGLNYEVVENESTDKSDYVAILPREPQ